MKKYIYHNLSSKNDNNAGSKASRDVIEIAIKNGYKFVKLFSTFSDKTTIFNVIEGLVNTIKLYKQLENGDIVFLQYPVNRLLMKLIFQILRKKNIHIITIIHDIDYLRGISLGQKGVDGMKKIELSLLRQSEYIICHNKFMMNALRNAGLKNKLKSLRIFDYLYTGDNALTSDEDKVIIAGNLAEQKAGYLYKLKDQGFKLSLYGSNLASKFQNSNFVYNGSFPPDVLIEHLEGSYGLVWDGDECDTCSGAYGNYLKINNPHKTSLYLAAGLPVIVWKESALYPFVMENEVGFGVNSLYEIENEIKNHNWSHLKDNVQKVQNKIRNGEYLKQVLSEIEEDIQHV